MTLAPIILFVYNRPWHTQQTVEALKANYLADQSILYIYSDAPKEVKDEDKVMEVRSYLRTIEGFKEIQLIEREKNWGLAANIVDGISKIVNKHGKIIVLEDDLLTAKNFLAYMNEGLRIYENVCNVFAINGYMFDISTIRNEAILNPLATSSWGWGTWDIKWKAYNYDINYYNLIQNNIYLSNWFNYSDYNLTSLLANLDSWAIKWYFSVKLKNGLGLFPTKSMVQNIGFDGSGVNYNKKHVIIQNLHHQKPYVELKQEIDLEIHAKLLEFFNINKKNNTQENNLAKRILKKIIYRF